MKIDLLFIVAHPDDVELCCAGTVFRHIEQGYTVGIVDITAGELGTRGNRDIRAEEAARASEIMGISFRTLPPSRSLNGRLSTLPCISRQAISIAAYSRALDI